MHLCWLFKKNNQYGRLRKSGIPVCLILIIGVFLMSATAEATAKKNVKYTIKWLNAISDIPREEWDRLALQPDTPLLEWQWLHHLEASGSIAPRAGWIPCHLTVWKNHRLQAAAPFYIKTHSDGEFIFDHWWAKLAKDFGIAYYPKLVGMSPVTPAVGYRFLTADEEQAKVLQRVMLHAIDQLCEQNGIPSCHFNFVDPQWQASVHDSGYIAWQHQSFLWRNAGFTAFEDYLGNFKSLQRRNIRRERQRMENLGIEIRALRGEQIPADMAGLMYRYYLNTNSQYGPWAAKYLNRSFFERVFEDYRHRLLIMAAYDRIRGDKPLALSMLLTKGRQLIGRYWGSGTSVKDLHFNMCFYAPIEWAIANRIETFDPGAGSQHKIYRGFKAVANTSLHRFYDSRLQALFLRFIDRVNQMESENIELLNASLPFRADG
jgi:predicted N-acyltransferase